MFVCMFVKECKCVRVEKDLAAVSTFAYLCV